MKPTPNLPVLTSSPVFFNDEPIDWMDSKSFFVNIELLYTSNAGPWNFSNSGDHTVFFPCWRQSNTNITSDAPASSAFCTSSLNIDVPSG